MTGSVAPPTFPSLHTAYFAILRELRDSGADAAPTGDQTSVGSRFGEGKRSAKELVGAGFRLVDPRARIIQSPQRRVNIAFAIANALWVFRGSDSLSEIMFYNPRAADFSDDGKTLAGAAGSRLLRPAESNQLTAAIQRLRADPGSRRAVVQLFLASDLSRPHRDTPCTIALQFLIRDGRLSCITFMRSQSAAFVMPYDVFLFTMIQEAVACELGIELGSYYHLCGSLHFYDDESGLVESLLASAVPPSPPPMPAMRKSPIRWEPLVHAEAGARAHLSQSTCGKVDLTHCELDAYWSDLLHVLVAGQRSRRNPSTVATAEVETLPSAYSALFQ